MNDGELNELRDSIRRLEDKVEKLLAQQQRTSKMPWKELAVGFVVVYIVMMSLLVTFGLINQHFEFFH